MKYPVGVAYNDIVETIQISNQSNTYGNSFFLDEGEALLERYIGVDFSFPEGGRAMYELVPIPDARSCQREFLPILGGESKVKLFPDLRWNLKNKTNWNSGTWLGGLFFIYFN